MCEAGVQRSCCGSGCQQGRSVLGGRAELGSACTPASQVSGQVARVCLPTLVLPFWLCSVGAALASGGRSRCHSHPPWVPGRTGHGAMPGPGCAFLYCQVGAKAGVPTSPAQPVLSPAAVFPAWHRPLSPHILPHVGGSPLLSLGALPALYWSQPGAEHCSKGSLQVVASPRLLVLPWQGQGLPCCDGTCHTATKEGMGPVAACSPLPARRLREITVWAPYVAVPTEPCPSLLPLPKSICTYRCGGKRGTDAALDL